MVPIQKEAKIKVQTHTNEIDKFINFSTKILYKNN